MRRVIVSIVVGIALLGGGTVGYWRIVHSSPLSRFESAWLSLREGRVNEVREQMDYLSVRPDFQIHRQVLRAGLLYRAGRAEAALQQLTIDSPDAAVKSKVLQLRGECLYMLGRYLEAREAFLLLASMKPNDPEPHRALAAVYFDLGYLTPSTEELRLAIQLDPSDVRAHRMLGRMEFETGHHQRAIQHYQLALEGLAATDRDEVIVELATAQMKLQQFQKARETLARVAKPSSEAFVLQAECERSLGHTETARETLNSALESSRNSTKARLLRARWHLDDDESEAAIALLREVLAASPYDTEGRYLLAHAFRRSGDNEKADAEMRRWSEIRELEIEFDKLQQSMWRNPRDDTSRLRLIEVAPQIGKQRIADFWSRAGVR